MAGGAAQGPAMNRSRASHRDRVGFTAAPKAPETTQLPRPARPRWLMSPAGSAKASRRWRASAAAEQQYQFLGRSSSSVLRGVGGGGGLGWGGPEVSADEVRSAASFSSAAGFCPPPPQAPAPLGYRVYPYPPSIHSAVLSPSASHAPSSPHPNEGLAVWWWWWWWWLPAFGERREMRKTLSARKVSATRGAASVPEEVFHRAKGVQLCNIEAYQCTPAFFADSYPLNQFSSEVITSRLPVPPSARVISERHIISVVPVTRVTMAHRKQSFSFYVVGYSRDVFIRDYPSQFCWGLCCCFEWLGK
ncbi:hypothetical protein C2845_PM06G26820 [Panicum miliaceum]|uniref:Uncharacterized protein n=1 Tax=Panicum miliaceum TaxID=4540 RepID=A0A3L6RA96_PANMI|nr:hypothetical protein C2845_PM06G26820 [Panicum miliaceum]